MINQNIENIIAKKHIGEATSSELQILDAWLSEDAIHQAIYEQYEDIWNVSADYEPELEVDSMAAFDKHMALLSQDETNVVTLKPQETTTNTPTIRQKETKVFTLSRVLTAVAAVFVLGFAVSTLFNTSEVITSGNSAQFVSLADGSSVWLDKNSSLTYDKSFGEDNREIKLEGKAFFDVERNDNLPFNIAAGEMNVSVLGTSFTVDESNATPTVSVKSGKVKVSNSDAEVFLVKNDKVELKTGSLVASEASQEDFVWRNPKLSFDNAPLSQVIADINLYYNSNLTLEGEDIDCPLTAGGMSTASFEEILGILSLTYDLDQSDIENNRSIKIKECK